MTDWILYLAEEVKQDQNKFGGANQTSPLHDYISITISFVWLRFLTHLPFGPPGTKFSLKINEHFPQLDRKFNC